MLPRLDVRWRIALMLCGITTINYLDRQALSVAAPVLMEEFSISNTQYGWITSAFLLAYAFGQLLTGPLIDRLGTRKAFSIAVVVWSLSGMLHALGRGFLSFFSLRALLGVGEAANFPAALKGIAEWFPRAERSTAVGILTMGPGLGAVLSPPLLGFLIYALGWEAAFLVPGAAGLLWVWLWNRMYFSPETHPGVRPEELALIIRGREDPASRGPRLGLRQILGYREVWGLMLSRFVSDGPFYFFVFWLPPYLASERGFNIVEIGLFAWIPFLAADAGSLAGGWSGQLLIGRGVSLSAARKSVIWVGALMAPIALPAVTADSPGVAIALIAASMFAIQVKASTLFALPADLFPSREVATIWGLSGSVGSLGGMVFSATVGWTIDQYSYLPVFVAVAILHLLSALLIQLLMPKIRLLPAAGAPVSSEGAPIIRGAGRPGGGSSP